MPDAAPLFHKASIESAAPLRFPIRDGATARAAGLRIPTDLSIVGFDDLPVAALVDPPLTTVRQPLTEMAIAATELALALGRGENPHSSDSSSPPP
jgi:DNA-binding LacI/PurR family transcriptional regulator